MKEKKVIICGGTGFIGKALSLILKQNGYYVTIFSRNAISARKVVKCADEFVNWDYRHPENIVSLIDNSFAIVNLAGASLSGGKWTKKYKKEIYDSRVISTQDLSNAINSGINPPKVLFNASAVGYYGNQGDAILTESSTSGNDFLAEVCRDWEKAANICSKTARVVTGRFGIVLSKDEGALPKLISPYKYFAGGSLGTGRQWYPWIHFKDLVSMILWSIENENVRGPVNCVSPNPVRMDEFAESLGRVLKKPSFLNVPEFALKILMGEMADMIINGQRVIPEKALELGYKFQFENLEITLNDLLK